MEATKTYNIKALRANVGMTQQDLADRLNIERRTLSKYETGAKKPDNNMLRLSLAQIFHVSPEDIRF